MLKRVMTLVLTLVLLVGVCLPAVEGHAAGATLAKKDGVWYYMENGKVINTTTLVKFNGSWWYVVNGKVASNTTTLVKFNGSWWYVVKGKVASNTTTLVKFNGSWWYVVKGKVASNTTSLVKFNGSWWYVVKGKVASNTTTLVKFNNEWWYIVKGKVASNTTTLVNFNGGWYYLVKGKLAAATTTLVKYNGTWYYVNEGKVDYSETLVEFNGVHYYVNNGKVDFSAEKLVAHEGIWRYVNNGKLDNQSTTMIEHNGNWYYVSQGRGVQCRDQIYSYGTVNYYYDLQGKLTYWEDSDEDFAQFYYDKRGRLSKVVSYLCYDGDAEWDSTDTYIYNSDGSWRVETVSDDYSEVHYDKNGRVTRHEFGNAGVFETGYYQYNSRGDLVSVRREQISAYDGSKVRTINVRYRYVYNAQGKPVSCIRSDDGTDVETLYYVYDAKGNMIREFSVNQSGGYFTQYWYSPSGRLTAEHRISVS